tara:strand:+ start:156 stop:392 length:237 start_codon:yes stop_codon:yes gene_type:complete
MGYFYEEWKNKKMTVENDEGQFIMNFGEAEDSMIDNLKTALIWLEEGASDEKESAKKTIKYYIDCLKTGKLKVKWTIS